MTTKRLHVHVLPLALAVAVITGFSALTVQVEQGNVFAKSVLQPAIGVGVWLANDGRVQASLQDAPIVVQPAGITDNLREGDVASGAEDGQDNKPADVLFSANRSLALQMALNDVPRRGR